MEHLYVMFGDSSCLDFVDIVRKKGHKNPIPTTAVGVGKQQSSENPKLMADHHRTEFIKPQCNKVSKFCMQRIIATDKNIQRNKCNKSLADARNTGNILNAYCKYLI